MRAAVLREPGKPDVLRIEEWPTPEVGPHDVLVEVAAVGVSAHDIAVRTGLMRRELKPPMILGAEISGIVRETGSQVTRVRQGDRVAAKPSHSCGDCDACRNGGETMCAERESLHGGYAEFAALPEESLVVLPDSVPLAGACMLGGVVAVAVAAVINLADTRPWDTVLVNGAGGGQGLHTIQVARLCGATVIAVTTSPDKVATIRENGADHVVQVARGEDFSAAVKDLTGGRGADVVVDNVGSATFRPTFRSLATGGRYVLVGELDGREIAINPALIFLKGARMIGCKSATRTDLRRTAELVGRGLLTPVAAGPFPLSEVAEVHRMVEAGDVLGRALMLPGE